MGFVNFIVRLEIIVDRYGINILQVGSDSYQGAGAPTMFEAMKRISANLGEQTVGECSFARAIRNSFLGTQIFL